jgi:hypothetical protein
MSKLGLFVALVSSVGTIAFSAGAEAQRRRGAPRVIQIE